MDQAEELDVILPAEPVSVGGSDVVVREYSFIQGMQVDAIANDFIRDLSALFLEREETGADFAIHDLTSVLGRYPAVMVQLLSMSIGQTQAWVKGLSDSDGQTLLLAWWGKNQSFFVRRLVQEVAARRATKTQDKESQSDGDEYSQP